MSPVRRSSDKLLKAEREREQISREREQATREGGWVGGREAETVGERVGRQMADMGERTQRREAEGKERRDSGRGREGDKGRRHADDSWHTEMRI